VGIGEVWGDWKERSRRTRRIRGTRKTRKERVMAIGEKGDFFFLIVIIKLYFSTKLEVYLSKCEHFLQ